MPPAPSASSCLQCLEQRKFPLKELKLFASARSAGKTMKFRGKDLPVQELTEASFAGVDIGLFSAGSGTTKKFAPAAVKAGTVIVDNSSAFRMDAGVPLVVPEINADAIFTHKGIIANPELLGDHLDHAALARAPAEPHQADDHLDVPGRIRRRGCRDGGAARIDARLPRRPAVPAQGAAAPVRVQRIQPQHEDRSGTGHNEEETKVINETRKIFGDPNIAIGITCVRIPVLRAHCVSVTFECEKPITPEEVRAIISKAPGCRVVDDQERNYFPMPVDASGKDDILVGRIRRDLSDSTGRSISLFSAGDQLLKGAALNAVQIAEKLLA